MNTSQDDPISRAQYAPLQPPRLPERLRRRLDARRGQRMPEVALDPPGLVWQDEHDNEGHGMGAHPTADEFARSLGPIALLALVDEGAGEPYRAELRRRLEAMHVPYNIEGERIEAYVSPEQRARIDRATADGYKLGWDAARAAYAPDCPI
jgi:hypothetical protein